MPATEWTMSLWMYIDTLEPQNGSVLEMIRPNMALYWLGTKLRMYSAQITNTQEVETTGRPSLKWIHSIMGAYNGVTFGVVTIKDGTQYTLSTTDVVTITSETICTGTTGYPFIVISTLGCRCRPNFHH